MDGTATPPWLPEADGSCAQPGLEGLIPESFAVVRRELGIDVERRLPDDCEFKFDDVAEAGEAKAATFALVVVGEAF